jgi:hypothetical protein
MPGRPNRTCTTLRTAASACACSLSRPAVLLMIEYSWLLKSDTSASRITGSADLAAASASASCDISVTPTCR